MLIHCSNSAEQGTCSAKSEHELKRDKLIEIIRLLVSDFAEPHSLETGHVFEVKLPFLFERYTALLAEHEVFVSDHRRLPLGDELS